MRSPDRRTLAVMLSRDRLMDIASKPNLRAIASIHSRVRAAVLPARIIKVPKPSSASIASVDFELVRASFLEVEGMQILTLSPVRGLWRGKHENGKSAGRHRPTGSGF
jgi:hypothetical protein